MRSSAFKVAMVMLNISGSCSSYMSPALNAAVWCSESC